MAVKNGSHTNVPVHEMFSNNEVKRTFFFGRDPCNREIFEHEKFLPGF